MRIARVQQAFSKNCLPASLFKKLLDRKPFKKRLERKPLLNLKRHDSVIASFLKKGLSENPEQQRDRSQVLAPKIAEI